MVNPNHRAVFPIGVEAIKNEDGNKKMIVKVMQVKD